MQFSISPTKIPTRASRIHLLFMIYNSFRFRNGSKSLYIIFGDHGQFSDDDGIVWTVS